MIEDLEIHSWLEREFDIIIDARSPCEFAESHIKGALNFYALDDEERAKTGTLYKNDKSAGKLYGASRLCANLSVHLTKIQELVKVGARIGIYCARGGGRSHGMAIVLSMIGYRVYRISGGYKAYRGVVCEYLNSPLKCEFITLFGNTGCGKSRILERLDKSAPVLNLEKLANHLGSSFGSIKGAQPSQKMFENELFDLLKSYEGEMVFSEGESARLGSLNLPKQLNTAIHEAYNVSVKADIRDRVGVILRDYGEIGDEFFYNAMEKISPFISKISKNKAIEDYKKGDLEAVAENLLINYYDKVYKKPNYINFELKNENLENSCEILLNLRENLKKEKE